MKCQDIQNFLVTKCFAVRFELYILGGTKNYFGFEFIIIKFELYMLSRTIFGYPGLLLDLNTKFSIFKYGYLGLFLVLNTYVQSRLFCSSGEDHFHNHFTDLSSKEETGVDDDVTLNRALRYQERLVFVEIGTNIGLHYTTLDCTALHCTSLD